MPRRTRRHVSVTRAEIDPSDGLSRALTCVCGGRFVDGAQNRPVKRKAEPGLPGEATRSAWTMRRVLPPHEGYLLRPCLLRCRATAGRACLEEATMGFEPMIRVLQNPAPAKKTLARSWPDSVEGSADSACPGGPRPLAAFWRQATNNNARSSLDGQATSMGTTSQDVEASGTAMGGATHTTSCHGSTF
jgi:hypothetical protein